MPRTATSLMTDAIATLDLIARVSRTRQPGEQEWSGEEAKKQNKNKWTLDVHDRARIDHDDRSIRVEIDVGELSFEC